MELFLLIIGSMVLYYGTADGPEDKSPFAFWCFVIALGLAAYQVGF